MYLYRVFTFQWNIFLWLAGIVIIPEFVGTSNGLYICFAADHFSPKCHNSCRIRHSKLNTMKLTQATRVCLRWQLFALCDHATWRTRITLGSKTPKRCFLEARQLGILSSTKKVAWWNSKSRTPCKLLRISKKVIVPMAHIYRSYMKWYCQPMTVCFVEVCQLRILSAPHVNADGHVSFDDSVVFFWLFESFILIRDQDSVFGPNTQSVWPPDYSVWPPEPGSSTVGYRAWTGEAGEPDDFWWDASIFPAIIGVRMDKWKIMKGTCSILNHGRWSLDSINKNTSQSIEAQHPFHCTKNNSSAHYTDPYCSKQQ